MKFQFPIFIVIRATTKGIYFSVPKLNSPGGISVIGRRNYCISLMGRVDCIWCNAFQYFQVCIF